MTEPTPLNAAELAGVRARCEAATPGPENVSCNCIGMCADIPRLLKTIEARETQIAFLGDITGREEDAEPTDGTGAMAGIPYCTCGVRVNWPNSFHRFTYCSGCGTRLKWPKEAKKGDSTARAAIAAAGDHACSPEPGKQP